MTKSLPGAEAAFRENERLLWGLGYRMTGSAADADEIVQETFQRALEKPPRDTKAPLKPWLVKVAVNLGRDRLRARKRVEYTGPWLPEPIADASLLELPEPAESRYGTLESARIAFLVALEALTAKQRAVLLLRDVLDYSVAETAGALKMSEPDVKTTLHRARKRMSEYDRTRLVGPDVAARTGDALQRFLIALSTGDTATAEKMLAADVKLYSDGGGAFTAAKRVLDDPSAITRFLIALAGKLDPARSAHAPAIVNGLPMVATTRWDTIDPRIAPRFVTGIALGADGRIQSVHAFLAPAKIARIAFPPRP